MAAVGIVAVVGGSVTAVAVGVVGRGVVGAGGVVETVDILGAVGAVAVALGAVAVHHDFYLVSVLLWWG